MRYSSNERALRLIDRLIKTAPNSHLAERAKRMKKRLDALPMADVLDKVLPGEPIAAKAKAIGVSRQTYYYWLNGETRPNKKLAKKLQSLTGVPADEIRGHAV